MKLGNVSQTIVPVPNFFIDRETRKIESFNLYNKTNINIFNKINKKKRPSLKMKSQLDLEETSSDNSKLIPKLSFRVENKLFRDQDILTTFYDLNLNNNPRFNTRKFLQMNKKKYIPIYYQRNFPDMTQINETYFPEIIELNKTDNNLQTNKNPKKILSLKSLQNYYNFKKFQKDENIEGLLSPTLREDIQNDTKNLIDRINMNYDIEKWNDFDSRKTFNRFFQTAYSPINDVNKNTTSIKDKFADTIRQKALSLKTINNKTKQVIQKSILKNIKENLLKEKNSQINEEYSFDNLLNNCKSNLLKLKYNNCAAPQYNTKDKLFIDENEFITQRINKTKLYSQFPSKTREEFNVKKIIKYKSLNKHNKAKGTIILKDKYGNNEDNFQKNKEDDYLKKMWIRPLHKDAFKLHE